MIWVKWHKPEPHAYDCLLLPDGRVYVAFEYVMVLMAAYLAAGQGWRRGNVRQLELWRAA